jgi:rhamnosyltransferase subunit B
MNRWTPSWFKRIQYWFADKLVLDPILAPDLNRFRRTLGLPPVDRIMHRWWFSPDLTLGVFDPHLVPDPGDWPVPVNVVGHTRWDPPVPNVTASFHTKKTAIFIPGSAGPTPVNCVEEVYEACRIAQIPLVVMSPLDHPELRTDDPNVLHIRYEPLSKWINQCSLMIHSGGIGVASHALAAGVPQLVFPSVNDQFDNARRLERLGVAQSLSVGSRHRGRIAQSIKSILNSDSIQASCQQTRLPSPIHSASMIADILEQFSDERADSGRFKPRQAKVAS